MLVESCNNNIILENNRFNFESVIQNYFDDIDVTIGSKRVKLKAISSFFQYLNEKLIYTPQKKDFIEYREYLLNLKLADTYICSKMESIRGFFKWLQIKNYYKDITVGVRTPRVETGFKKDSLSREQVIALLDNFTCYDFMGKPNMIELRDRALLNLMVRTGLRCIEIQRLVKSNLVVVQGKQVLKVWGKGRSSASDIVKLTPQAYEPLQEYLSRRKKIGPDDYIFVSASTKNKNEQLTTRSISRIVKQRLKRVNIDDDRITAHSLRHTSATLALLGGARERDVQNMLRHKDLSTTLRYAHDIERLGDKSAEDMIAAYL